MKTQTLQFNVNGIITRSPRLETVTAIENFIKEKSGDFKKTDLFNNLPKKIMWGTFNVILKYLYENNKIGVDRKGFIIYIWNPELAAKLINRKRY
ncbi:MAG: hypothetical protein U9Q06_03315 [Nanoarchaeota archaeon]|nr:hypothetical protein [Nanoarchaeota archaeon]